MTSESSHILSHLQAYVKNIDQTKTITMLEARCYYSRLKISHMIKQQLFQYPRKRNEEM